MSFLTSLYSPGNIMDEVDIDNLTIEQFLRLTQESQTPKKIEDMNITEYLEYEKKVNENHISNTKSYLPTYFDKSTLTHDPIREFAHYFGTESDCDSEDIEEEVEYITDDEVVMSEQEESNHGYTQNIHHFKEKDDVDEWLNAEITKHMSMQGVKNMKDALISIIKSIRQEMKDGIMIRQVEASTTCVSDEVSSIASNEVDKDDDNTLNIAPCQLPKELSPGSFLLLFNIDNHSFYAITTLDAKDNIMPLKVYKYLGLDKFRDNKLKHYWKSTNDNDRMDLEWEGLSCTNWVRARKDSRLAKDKGDLEGIINYLEPTLYDGFIDPDNEAYKLRRNKLHGMPYSGPLPNLKEEAKITRYNLGAGEVCSLEALTRLNSSTWATKWFKRLVAYAKCNRDSYESELVSPSEEQVATEPHSPVLNENTNELIQEDDVEFDGCVFYNPPQTPVFKEAESSSTYQYPSDMHEFHQQHRSTDKWTKNHLIEQMIGDRSKASNDKKTDIKSDAEVLYVRMTSLSLN
ncbi:hypothetical protein Tco_1176478 [Tanacetum coccineum]